MKILSHIMLLFCAVAVVHADSLNDLNGVVAGKLKVPFYNNDRLQAIVFAKSAEYREQLLFGNEVLINLVARNADTDKVANDSKLEIYPLKSNLLTVGTFWLPHRYLWSDSVIWSESAIIDRSSRTASGNVAVKMRSHLVDLDGLGFNVDFTKRQIRVNKEVEMVLRMPSSDPRKFREVKKVPLNPLEYQHLKGKGDLLHLDLAENRIMLIGHVIVENAEAKIACDRLTVIMGGDKNKSSDDLDLNAAGVQAIYADGNVRIQKMENGKKSAKQQELFCDHLVFDVEKDTVTLTNDKGQPRINFGVKSFVEGRRMIFFRKNQQSIFPDDCFMQSFDPKDGVRTVSCDYGNLRLNDGICDLLGNVKMEAADGNLKCDSMRVFLKKKPQKTATKNSSQTLIGDMQIGVSEIERVLCKGTVQLERVENGKVSTLYADNASMNYRQKKVSFNKNVHARLNSGKGKDSLLSSDSAFMDYEKNTILFKKNVVIRSESGNLYSDKLEIQLSKEKNKREFQTATATGNVKIERLDKDGKAILTATKGFFDYAHNLIVFSDKVSSRKAKSSLDCEKLELFLTDQKDGSAENTGIPGLMETGGHGKNLDHAYASGKVRFVDGPNNLNADKCQLFFGPARPKDKKKPGLLQAGSLRLLRIVCDGNITAFSKNDEKMYSSAQEKSILGKSSGSRTLKAQHSETDLIRHTSLFTGNVLMTNGENQLECDKLTFFAVPIAPGQKTQKVAQTASIDDDPYATLGENAQGSIPQSIIFDNGKMQLKKIISLGNVIVSRKDSEQQLQQIFCDKATFDGDTMVVVCKSTPPNRPKLKTKGVMQTARQYRIIVREERVEAVGGIDTELE